MCKAVQYLFHNAISELIAKIRYRKVRKVLASKYKNCNI